VPSVSVVVPVFDAQQFLPAALESILSQTLSDWELIAIDDGSTDRSLAILRSFAAKDSRIRIISRENRGIERTLNEGIELAGGEFIARMDADDIAMPERLALQLEFMRAHKDVVLLGGGYLLIDSWGRELTTRRPPTNNSDLQKQLLGGQNPFCHSLVIMRRAAVKRVGGYSTDLPAGEDIDLWLRMGEIGQVACLDRVLLKYRLHGATISELKQELQMRSMRRACERAWNRRGVQGEFKGQIWRPMNTRDSRYEFALRYGWWAFNGGHPVTAASYGFKAVLLKPWRQEGWKLIACSAVKTKPVRA
jgi:glycosyltransferase involved in cell wall biosynthesis